MIFSVFQKNWVTGDTCHMSCVMCHVSCVTCHVSHVMRHVSHVKKNNNGGASWWRVCYQRGLPRLVFWLENSAKAWYFGRRNTCSGHAMV